MFIPVWVISTVVILILASIPYIFVLLSQRKKLVNKATQIYTKIKVDLPGSPEAIKKAKWDLAYQMNEEAKLKFHENIALMRERSR